VVLVKNIPKHIDPIYGSIEIRKILERVYLGGQLIDFKIVGKYN
jgi:hypothetical protein